MEHFVNMLAAVVVTLAVAALSLFGVRLEAPRAAAPVRPAVITRTLDRAPVRPVTGLRESVASDSLDLDCPEHKTRAAAPSAA